MHYLSVFIVSLALTQPAFADLVEDVRCREIGFSKSVETQDVTLFASFIDADARFVSNVVTHGPEAIAAAWGVFFTKGGPTIKWRPQFVEVLETGTLALTRGPYRMVTIDEQGKMAEHWGTFNSVWRLQENGEWNVVFDAGSPASEAPADTVKTILSQEDSCEKRELGWTMGLEPTTTGITTRGSTN